MRLVEVKIQNYRAYKQETAISFTNPTVVIGKNDAGKSTILDALDHFFNGTKIEPADCSVGSDTNVVRITCVFDQYPNALILDEDHPTRLPAEFLTNGAGNLEIIQEHKANAGKNSLVVYARCVHPTLANADDLLSLTNAKLKQRARAVAADLTNVNETVNPELRAAIRAKLGHLNPALREIELPDKMWANIQKHLPVFAVFRVDRESTDQDSEAQDPMKSAVKQAIRAQQEQLRAVTEAVKIQVQEIAAKTVEKIKEMAPELASQLTPHVETKAWDGLFSVSLTGDGDIPINKRGSGTRRLVLLNFFRAEAERVADGKQVSVVYAVEEPETSQHPINQVMLTQAFQELSLRPGCQVIVTTHTPNLARRFRDDQLLLIKPAVPAPTVTRGDQPDCLADIAKSLGIHADNNIKVFVGVEGPNDMTFWRNLSKVLVAAGENVPDIEQAEAQGKLMFVPLGGSNLTVWTSRLEGLNRPEVYIMDRDTVPPAPAKYAQFATDVAARGAHAFTTSKREIENYVHHSLMIADFANYAGTGAQYEDVPSLLAQVTHEAALGAGTWGPLDIEKKRQKDSQAKKRLCGHYTSLMTKALLQQTDPTNELIGVLNHIKSFL